MKVSSGTGLVHRLGVWMEQDPSSTISFKRFMQACLYDEDYGYYMTNNTKVGKAGDFYTSSNIGTVMGEVLARDLISRMRLFNASVPGIDIAEWGGGTGRLAKQILDELQKLAPELYTRIRYSIIEESPFHQERQKLELKEHEAVTRVISSAEWLRGGPYSSVIVLANELLDAFSVERCVYKEGTGWHQVRVGWNQRHEEFTEFHTLLEDGELLKYLQAYILHPQSGQVAEVNLDAEDWVQSIAESIVQGNLIVIDYGDTYEEIYAPHRLHGTLLCYYKHSATTNPYIRVGDQDITTHVNFTGLMHAGSRSGMEVERYSTQKKFLLDAGLLEWLTEHSHSDPFHPVAKRNRAVRQLLISDSMSELFKVLVLSKTNKRR
ncbi:hypothetical protein SY83_14940 [Paenibacillus swuensis]|uniref:SAM-dependent methyltransferase n=1 Tax=Paenibacillus swuensis TaxID=1178515 RepID=A0A172TJZ7_9BACL|nr:SAM-dependent methyltransferase [Paenibacillus swuensis]ANE47350.1 hypothetical protein SY83_14940 [Paenibacillus swuensis]